MGTSDGGAGSGGAWSGFSKASPTLPTIRRMTPPRPWLTSALQALDRDTEEQESRRRAARHVADDCTRGKSAARAAAQDVDRVRVAASVQLGLAAAEVVGAADGQGRRRSIKRSGGPRRRSRPCRWIRPTAR